MSNLYQEGSQHQRDFSKFTTPFYKQYLTPQAIEATGRSGQPGGRALDGGVSQCYKMFQRFSRCYANAEEEKVCQNEWEDWEECLSNKKEKERIAKIYMQFQRNELAQGKSKAEIRRHLKQGMRVTVGLIEAETDLAQIQMGNKAKGT